MLRRLRGENKSQIPLVLSRYFLKSVAVDVQPWGRLSLPCCPGVVFEAQRAMGRFKGGHVAEQEHQPCQGSLKKHHGSSPLSLPQALRSAAHHWLILGPDFS